MHFSQPLLTIFERCNGRIIFNPEGHKLVSNDSEDSKVKAENYPQIIIVLVSKNVLLIE